MSGQSLDGLEVVAFRRLVTRLSGVDEPEVDEMNAVEKVNHAVDRVEQLEAENERLKERVAELEAQVDPDPTNAAYEDMDREDRVRKLREVLLNQAQGRQTGKAQMGYKDVLLVFDNHPSPAYAYQLMEVAANADGYEYVETDRKVLRVDSDAVNDESLIYSANKANAMEAD